MIYVNFLQADLEIVEKGEIFLKMRKTLYLLDEGIKLIIDENQVQFLLNS